MNESVRFEMEVYNRDSVQGCYTDVMIEQYKMWAAEYPFNVVMNEIMKS